MRTENRQVVVESNSEVYKGFNREEIREMLTELPNEGKLDKPSKPRVASSKLIVLDTIDEVKESFNQRKTQEILKNIKMRTFRAQQEIAQTT
jgi:hypothetical protein